MDILIIDGDKRAREVAARYLSKSGHQVEATRDLAAARRLLKTRSPDTIIVDLSCAATKLLDFLSWVRAREQSARPYLIISLSRSGFPPELKSALAHGADDVVRKPWTPEELVLRVETFTRIKALLAESSGAPQKHLDLSATDDLTTLECWQTLDDIVASDLSELLSMALSIKPLQDGLLHASMAAQIPMTIPQNQARVQIGLGLQEAGACSLAKHIFEVDGVPTELIKDLLRECANTAGGAFKRAAEHENTMMTTGLPEDVHPQAFHEKKSVDQRHFELVNEDASVRLFVEVELRSKGHQKLVVSELQEGMVLSRDLLNASGMLLVRSGTRLTSSNVERLHRLVSMTKSVEVAA